MGVVYGIVVHATRSGQRGNPNEGIGTVTYCCTPGTTSYHYVIDRDGAVYELVPPGTVAWHAGSLNWHWLGVALAQGTEDDPITPEQHESLGWVLRRLCHLYEIPRGRIIWLGSPTEQRGIVEHKDTAQGRRYGKSDVGPRLDWGKIRLA